MAQSPLTKLETAVLVGLVLILLAVTTLGILRERGAAPRVSFIAAQERLPYRININTASVEELTLLRGIGPAKAQAIVAWRQEHGPFRTTNELRNVPGISDKIVQGMLDFVTLGSVESHPGRSAGDRRE